MKKLIISAVSLLTALGLSACGFPGSAGKTDKEITAYLESRYGSEKFQVEKVADGSSAPAWTVIPADYPEAVFTVEEGKLEESSDWNYHDDFAAQMLYGGADRLGISYIRGEDGYDMFVTYTDYGALDDLAPKLEQLVTDCRDSQAFDKLRDTCLITVKPESETSPYFPGYEIRIDTRYTYPVDNTFGVMASDLEPGQLADSLRQCHVYNSYNYTIQEDSDLFSSEDIEHYKTICTGAMGTAKDGTITIYDLANKDDLWMSYGSAYWILSKEGLVTDASPDSFTASGNGFTIEFTRHFSAKGPSASYQVLDGSEEFLKDAMEEDIRDAVGELTAKSITFSTPEKIAAAEEEERLGRLPMIQEAFDQSASFGETVALPSAQVALTDLELLEELNDGGVYTMHSNENEVWVRVQLSIKNTSSADLDLFHLVFRGEDSTLFAIVSDQEANLYNPIEIINLDLEELYSSELPSGESTEGSIYFELPRTLAEKGNELVLLLLNGTEISSILLPAP